MFPLVAAHNFKVEFILQDSRFGFVFEDIIKPLVNNFVNIDPRRIINAVTIKNRIGMPLWTEMPVGADDDIVVGVMIIFKMLLPDTKRYIFQLLYNNYIIYPIDQLV